MTHKLTINSLISLHINFLIFKKCESRLKMIVLSEILGSIGLGKKNLLNMST